MNIDDWNSFLNANSGWLALGSAILAVIGAITAIWSGISSSDSAKSSRISAEASREMPYRVALFEQRTSALRTYTQAHGTYSATLRKAAQVISPTSGNPKADGSPDPRLVALSGGVVDAYYAYTTDVNASRAVWEEPVEQQIMVAGDLARLPLYCFTSINDAAQGLSTAQRLHHQAGVGEPCSDMLDKIRAFDSESNRVIQTMIQQVNGSWTVKSDA